MKGMAILIACVALCLSLIALMNSGDASSNVDIRIINGKGAICQSGAYSVSQSRRGTCAHHGGVKEWINGDDR